MPNVVYQCRKCGLSIDADDRAVVLSKDVGVRTGGSIDITEWQQDEQVAHEGHDGLWRAQGDRVVRSGPLREIVP